MVVCVLSVCLRWLNVSGNERSNLKNESARKGALNIELSIEKPNKYIVCWIPVDCCLTLNILMIPIIFYGKVLIRLRRKPMKTGKILFQIFFKQRTKIVPELIAVLD